MKLDKGDIDEAAREEVYRALEEVVEEGFEDFDVTEIESWGRSLTVQLDSLEHRRRIHITIDDNP
jgi:hypothetical protein